jgi:hypothetical protein
MSLVLTIDLAHPPLLDETIEQELLDAWTDVRNSPDLRAIKVIHGYGSTGKGSRTKEIVRNWTFRNKSKFRAVIEGERYSIYEQPTQELRKALGPFADTDLDAANPGMTLIWVK